jgi:fatty-acyl-CoA synthase
LWSPGGEAYPSAARPKVAKWWLPDAVEFLDKLPMTGTGKIHKLTLRQQFKDYQVQQTAAE